MVHILKKYDMRNKECIHIWLRTRTLQAIANLSFSNTEIASAMRISEKTVKNHIASMFQKVHVNNRNKLVAIAVRNNWISMK